jgi:hypothetical protein
MKRQTLSTHQSLEACLDTATTTAATREADLNSETNSAQEVTVRRTWQNLDTVAAYVTGAITFVVCMIYAISTYGLLFGIAFGGLVSLVVAFFAALLWPSVALLALAEVIVVALTH